MDPARKEHFKSPPKPAKTSAYKTKNVASPSATNSNQLKVKRDWPNWDSPTKNWTKSAQDFLSRGNADGAFQHTKSSSQQALTPMQRWEEEKQRDAPYNTVTHYTKIAGRVSEASIVDEEVEGVNNSTSATVGDSADGKL